MRDYQLTIFTMTNFNYTKFFKKYRIRLFEKVLDTAILLSVGYALGLHLVRGV